MAKRSVKRALKPTTEGIIVCSVCGIALPESFTVTVRTKVFCLHCARKKGLFRCDHCHKSAPISSRTKLDDRDVCVSCAEKHYVPCAYCGNRHEIADMKVVGTRAYCVPCFDQIFTVCPDCNRIVKKGDMFKNQGMDHKVCSHCIQHIYAECRVCHQWYKRITMTQNDRGFYCSSCNPRSEVREASYKPTPVFFGKESRNFFGIELEVECKNPIATIHAMDMTEEFYVKRDGSLSARGVELVSMPCTLDYHKNNIKWEERCARLTKAGTVSHNTETCGLHIHMSSDRLSKLECMKLSLFMHKNMKHIAILARRDRPYGHEARNPEDVVNRILKKGEYKNSARYDYLNWGTHTVEFRLPKGTLNAGTLLATIELCDASIEYSGSLSLGEIKNGSFNAFLLWCQSSKRNRARYSNLLAYYEKKGKCPVMNALRKSALAKVEHDKKVPAAAPVPAALLGDEVEDPRYCRL